MEFKEKLLKLKEYFEVKSNRELAEKLELSKEAIDGWTRRETIPRGYLKLIEEKEKVNKITNTGANSINVMGNNHGHININSSDEMSMAICKEIKKLDDDRKEYYYHLIKADVLKKKIGN